MNHTVLANEHKIDKRHVEATVLFMINHMPQADRATLEKFLELVNATGNFGSIADEQLLNKMKLILKYVPGACQQSLVALAELLEICSSQRSYPQF